MDINRIKSPTPRDLLRLEEYKKVKEFLLNPPALFV